MLPTSARNDHLDARRRPDSARSRRSRQPTPGPLACHGCRTTRPSTRHSRAARPAHGPTADDPGTRADVARSGRARSTLLGHPDRPVRIECWSGTREGLSGGPHTLVRLAPIRLLSAPVLGLKPDHKRRPSFATVTHQPLSFRNQPETSALRAQSYPCLPNWPCSCSLTTPSRASSAPCTTS